MQETISYSFNIQQKRGRRKGAVALFKPSTRLEYKSIGQKILTAELQSFTE